MLVQITAENSKRNNRLDDIIINRNCFSFFRLEVVSTLLHVFVDIEMTGQAVAFEMKFSYRRPMYEIMKYLWEMEDYKKK